MAQGSLDNVEASPVFHKSPFQDACPVNSLPPEILSTIFFLAYPENQLPQKVTFEVLLGHVCKYWRNVAHGTATLWTTITIYSPRTLQWLPVYLQRAGTFTSFSITIDAYRWDKLTRRGDAVRLQFAHDVADHILPVFSRVEKLTLLCHKEVTINALQRYLQDVSADALRVFELRFEPHWTANRQGHPLFSNGAPKLRYFRTAFPDCRPPESVLGNLTTLHLELGHHDINLTYPEFANVMKAARSVRYLTISDCTQSLMNAWPLHLTAPDFTLPNLEGLRIFNHGLMAAKLLLSISAPKLVSLWLHCSLDSLDFFFDAPQMQPSGTPSSGQPITNTKFPSLRYFTVFNDVMYSAVKFAIAFPNITHLHVPFANFYNANQFQAALTFHWPMLRTIVLTMVRETKWMRLTSALAVALPARRQDNRPLDTVLVDKDYRLKLNTLVPKIDDLVDVVDLTEENYHEPWWNKADQAGFF